MFRFLTPRRLALLALAALALPVALAGCGKQVTSADATYTTLEGVQNPDSRLMVWPNEPNTVWIWQDEGQPGPTVDDDFLKSTEHVYRGGAGTYQSMLLDGTLASGFEMYRRAGNGGYEPMRDYVLTAPRKWLDSQWELYELNDASPSSFSPPTYQGRGLLEGTVTARSPLTNAARVTAMVDTSLKYLGNVAPIDSLFLMEWTSIPGAAGYWIHVYQFRADASNQEVVESGTPSPVWNGKVRDNLVAYVAAPATQYRFGDPGALVLTETPPIRGQVYLVRITAIDPEGQIISYMAGANGFLQEEGQWKIFPLAATQVIPGRHSPALAAAPARLRPGAPGTFGIPGFGIMTGQR